MRTIVMLVIACVACSEAAAQTCTFDESTAKDPTSGAITLPWRTDYPNSPGSDPHPWSTIDFKVQWREYLAAVLSTIKSAGFRIENSKIVMNPGHRWWIAQWMDYGAAGRESMNGLTKERAPRAGDLAQGAPAGAQLWAVGWYNSWGAIRLRSVFANRCNPQISNGQVFRLHTASFKTLFTDADPDDVSYLQGSPTITAMIDPPGVTGNSNPANRQPRQLRLLQIDIAVRDNRATDTRWVFGTYVWKGPPTGDGLFDNLVPVGLHWGNDPGNVGTTMNEGKVNSDLDHLLYNRPGREWMGFRNRVNGPADNKFSACLSCHGASQWPRSSRLSIVVSGNVGTGSDDIQQHVDDYFRNIRGGQLFDTQQQGAVALDYSLQLEAAFTRICTACQTGALVGRTPRLCFKSPRFDNLGVNCNLKADKNRPAPLPLDTLEHPLPRQ
ncbi:MAG TPA: hypothetical protein VFB88_13100 [Xanthobacteraceae bacterium]|jgi:hypothetical protein|nr:hypothetical protein [Xanthobacteraceae bacterium]